MSTQHQNWKCVTRALKNARYLQKVAPHIMPEIEPAEGFDSAISLQILEDLHTPDRPHTNRTDPHLAELLRDVQLPTLLAIATGPLFQGTLIFLHISFTIQDQNNA